jgi:hypothetical protein
MVDMKIAENVEPLKKREKLVKRNANGQFERGNKALAGAGRPRGSLNKISASLKTMILNSLDRVGGEQYLERLAIENSSAYAGLLGKILPSVLATEAESNGGVSAKITFTRVIVYPDGHREIEGVTPKQLPEPASHVLPGSDRRVSNSDDSDDKSDT